MENPPRVLILSDAAGVGGAEQVITTLVATATSTQEARFIAAVPSGNASLIEMLTRSGATVQPIRDLDRRLRVPVILQLLGIMRRQIPDGVLVNLTDQGDGQSLLVASRIWSGPSAALVHLYVPDRPSWRATGYRLLLKGARRVVTPGTGTAIDLARIGVDACVVANGLLPERLTARSEARAQLGLEPDSLVVGGIGRLTEQKGWDVLQEAWPAVLAAHPEARAVLIGDGPLRPALEQGPLELRGSVPQASRLLLAFDLLVAPSRFEAHALTPIEAAMAGVPAVLSDVAGVRESAGPGSQLVPPGDPAALADGIIEVLGDLAARTTMARDDAEVSVARHDPRAMVKGLLDAVLHSVDR
jgi:glycosyltransferase involved in cell wall biosynthesis